MRIILCSILCLLFASSHVPNTRLIRQIPLPELIVHSDNIIIGEIKSRTDTTITLQSIETLKGKPVQTDIVLTKREGIVNTRAIQKNSVGQTELFFLTYDNDTKKYQFYTDHGEAEYLIKDSLIYIYGMTWYLKKNREIHPHDYLTVDGITFDASIYNKQEMCIAIKDYLLNYKKIIKLLYKEPDIKHELNYRMPQKEEIKLQNKFLIEFSDRSPSHHRLIDELMDDPRNIW